MRASPRTFLLAATLSPALALAQNIPPSSSALTPKADYALTNVRIVAAPGRVIERGTVLMRDGRIAAVGADVAVPAGVVRLDLPGHTVFPGLIDAATSVGLPSPTRPLPATAADAAAGGGRGGAGGRGAAPPQGGRGVPLGRGQPPAPPGRAP